MVSLFPGVEGLTTGEHRFNVRGDMFRGDVWGKFFTEDGECLESAASGGGGSRHVSNIQGVF